MIAGEAQNCSQLGGLVQFLYSDETDPKGMDFGMRGNALE